MGAVDRTLLANLGFNDPDKNDPLHDLGCQYLAQPHVVNSIGLKKFIAKGVGLPFVFDPTSRVHFEYPVSKGQNQYKTTIGFLDVVLPLRYEFDDTEAQGTGKTLRFATSDEGKKVWEKFTHEAWQGRCVQEEVRAVTANQIEYAIREQAGKPEHPYYSSLISRGVVEAKPAVWEQPELIRVPCKRWSNTHDVLVEVKIGPKGLGDILRQINLYREYTGDRDWIFAAAFDMSTQLVEGLRSHEIFPVQLGAGFRKWAAEQQAAPRATNVPSL